MFRYGFLSTLVIFSIATGLLRAQEGESITADSLRQKITALADSGLDEVAQTAAKQRLEEAVTQVEAADGFAAKRTEFESILRNGPAEVAKIRKQLEDRQAGREKAEPELPANADAAAIDTKLTAERSRLAEAGRLLREAEAALAEIEQRPTEIRERMAAVTRAISEAQTNLTTIAGKGAPTPGTIESAQTKLRMVKEELAMLEQEALSIDARRDLSQARRDLYSSDQAQIRQRVAALETRSGALVTERIGEAEDLIQKLGLAEGAHADALREFVKETRDLAKKNQTVLGKITAAEAERTTAEDDLRRLRRESENLRAQIEIGGLEESFSEIVLDMRRTLPTAQSLRQDLTNRHRQIAEARLEAFKTDREADALPSIDGQVEEKLVQLRTAGVSEDDLAKLRPGLRSLLENRAKLLRDNYEANRRLAATLGDTDLVVGEIITVADSFRDYLGERLVWIASSPPLRKSAFTGVRTSLIALAGPEALADYGRTLARVSIAHWLFAIALGAILLIPRKRLRTRLQELARRTHRVSTDRIGNTLSALGISLWLALPLPTLLAFFGYLFSSDPSGESVTFALGRGLSAPALLLLALRFASVLCWPGGVAEAHFRWHRPTLDAIHRALLSAIFLYLPAHLLLTIWWHDSQNLAAFQGPGRLVFVIAMLTMALLLRHYFRSIEGLTLTGAPPRSRFAKLRTFWTHGIILVPVALAILAAMGHFLTAVAIAFLIQKTALVLLTGMLVSAFLTRWAALRGRRMALAEAIAERQARRKAAAESAAPEAQADETIEIPEEDEPLDLEAIGEQAHHLIRAVVAVIAVFGCWLAWSEALPALRYFDTKPLFGQTTLSDLVRAAVVAALTWIGFQNLPGLLELGFLRALELESGVRNAVLTLCQYAVIAIGAALGFEALGLDWSQFGWIAAALGVGIGFGLQEVVANFVSGLILLFERPIRVGDIVTVGGIDGVVTKIRIRATTITDWDKKDFVVPNKEFITGTILNWTLSNPVTRLVFRVGVAYGTDVEKVVGILLDIARSQPEVLTDPKPAAVFETFGDSCLNFSLRCFVGSPDQRLDLTHHVNTLIHERFAAAGIEIPFPQRDVNVRSVPEGFGGKGAEKGRA